MKAEDTPQESGHKRRRADKAANPTSDGTDSAKESRLDALRRDAEKKQDQYLAWFRDRAERVPHPTRLDRESQKEWAARITKNGELAKAKANREREESAATILQLATRYAHPGHEQKLIADAREITERAATNVFSRLTEPQCRKLEKILSQLRKLLQDEVSGQNERAMRRIYDAYKIIDVTITSAKWTMTMTELPTKTREGWVRNVAFLWNEQTGRPAKASRDMQNDGKTLTNTPLVRFIRATLGEALPGLTNGEILRGVKEAQRLIDKGTPRWF